MYLFLVCLVLPCLARASRGGRLPERPSVGMTTHQLAARYDEEKTHQNPDEEKIPSVGMTTHQLASDEKNPQNTDQKWIDTEASPSSKVTYQWWESPEDTKEILSTDKKFMFEARFLSRHTRDQPPCVFFGGSLTFEAGHLNIKPKDELNIKIRLKSRVNYQHNRWFRGNCRVTEISEFPAGSTTLKNLNGMIDTLLGEPHGGYMGNANRIPKDSMFVDKFRLEIGHRDETREPAGPRIYGYVLSMSEFTGFFADLEQTKLAVWAKTYHNWFEMTSLTGQVRVECEPLDLRPWGFGKVQFWKSRHPKNNSRMTDFKDGVVKKIKALAGSQEPSSSLVKVAGLAGTSHGGGGNQIPMPGEEAFVDADGLVSSMHQFRTPTEG